ncbi:amino acid ABC transporter substrate-binding protein (PAAT family) [Salinibacterium amurskyense]|uniref:Amino acid ABC transporter substrate-binding protein (PAAT family) n=1 Tax=Salinibacterium amurskyense TaxID=205941 RepID=A0A2M9D2S4_9MICO|nr:ABC transporter substrate-binding protein [Salinibacterium amurskyense]PJJ78471.1 amino acid ABC transporter substrate-binding protein (PAAT family) [Salinibacterium amurskyense]RLQ80569.1 amino acid ABC transporter substrate-binding protein [Salinibacterium amurskyense]GHD83173.1 amino acid ABC transporter substrate-binding protein [Salinibacterium amurskyense]
MTSSRHFRRALVATAAAAVLALTACSADTTADTSSTVDEGSLPTLTAGKLTIATGEPAYAPWMVDNDPTNGEGFEAAVAYALADELGFTADDVVWVRSSFDSAIAPGPKDWDLNLQQFSITEDRKQAVDFSSPYYTTTQAIIATESSAAADATTLDDLKDVVVGVASGSTSYTIAAEALGDDLSVFNSNEDGVLALTSGQIDAFVIDLPSAFYLANVEIDGGVILGQFESSAGGDEFAFVLPKNSELTSAVSEALDALAADGTLQAIQDEWLSAAVDVPVLK